MPAAILASNVYIILLNTVNIILVKSLHLICIIFKGGSMGDYDLIWLQIALSGMYMKYVYVCNFSQISTSHMHNI